MSTQGRKDRPEQNAEPESTTRTYELVMADEFRRLHSRNYKHHDLLCAIREMKRLPVGQGVKLKCPGTPQLGHKKQKAAIAIANREKIVVRTMLRDGWLFIEKVREK